jgi:hypothetical protein
LTLLYLSLLYLPSNTALLCIGQAKSWPSLLPKRNAVQSCADAVCDFNAQLATYTRTQICEKPLYGISGGCPFVDNLALGVCSDAIYNVQRLALAERVTTVQCWPNNDKTAVSAVRFTFSSGTTRDLGNEATSGAFNRAVATLDTSSFQVRRVQLWYSGSLDTAKRVQLGRLRITLTQGSVMDCGDTSLDLNAADLDNAVDPEAVGGLGSMLLGAIITSTSAGPTNNKSISINGFSLLLLRKPVRGVFTIEKPDFDPSDVDSTKFTDQAITTYSNAGNLPTMTVQCPAYEVSVETSSSYENSETEVQTFEAGFSQTASVGYEASVEISGESSRLPVHRNVRTRHLRPQSAPYPSPL